MVTLSAFLEIDGVLSVKLQRCDEPVEEVPLSRQNGSRYLAILFQILVLLCITESMSTISLVIEEELKSSLTNAKGNYCFMKQTVLLIYQLHLRAQNN